MDPATEPRDSRTIESERIRALADAVVARVPGAVDGFWAEADGATPLFERIDDETTLVTFLWRDPGDTVSVLVLFYSAPGEGGIDDFMMERLAGTDLWFRSYRVPSDMRTTYLLSVNGDLRPFADYDDVMSRISSYRTDPLNPRDYTLVSSPNEFKVSILELPAAPKQPWNIRRRGVERGIVELHEFDSPLLGTHHHLGLYLPPGYDPQREEPYHLMVLFDGWSYLNFASIATVFDNLIHVGRIPEHVVLLHSNESQDVRAVELPCNENFHQFLVEELMPWVAERTNVTSEPTRTTIAGSCFGGIAAAYAALRSPDRFGNVIAQSGSFWWPRSADGVQQEWLIDEFDKQDRLAVRFALEIGSLETAIIDYRPMDAHRRMRDVLLGKGYEVDYSEYTGGHDMGCWRGSIVDRIVSFFPRVAEASRAAAASEAAR